MILGVSAGRGSSSRLRRMVLGLLCFGLFAAGVALGDDRRTFKLPEGPANVALREYAKQARRQILIPRSLLAGYRTNAVQGLYSPDKALALLLKGTPLTAQVDESGTLVVKVDSDFESEGSNTMKKTDKGFLDWLAGVFGAPATAAMAAVTATAGAMGQELPSEDVKPSRQIEEIVVTAQKREQSLVDVPQSIQVFEQNGLVELSVRDISELMTFVPGASEGQGSSIGQRRFQIRGVYQDSGSATIGYYLDEAPIDSDVAAPIGRMYDMQQVEVLRGPQGTLWGNGAMGGVVRYIPNQPDLSEFRAGLRAGYSTTEGGDDGRYGDAFASIPIIEDELGVRLVASQERLGGWADTLNGPENINQGDLRDLRMHVLWEPSEDWRLRIMYSSNTADQDGGGILLDGFYPNESISSGGENDFYDNEMEVLSGVLEFKGLESLDVVSIFSSVKNTLNTELFIPIPGLTAVTFAGVTEIETVSNETRFLSKGDGAFQWMVGSYITARETDRSEDIVWDPEIPPAFLNSNTTVVDDRDSMAFFGELSWSLMDGRLVPLVGLRWAEEEFKGDTVTAAGLPDGKTFDTTNFRFNLSWFPSDSQHYFLNIADGFRSGALNELAICTAHNALLIVGECELAQESDELTSYEVGGKYMALDGRLYAEGAAYFIDWQRTPQELAVGGTFQPYDVGDSEILGADLSLRYQPKSIPALGFNFVANWIQAEISDANTYISDTLVPPFEPVSVGPGSGDFLPFVPRWSASLAIDYSWSFGAGRRGLANLAWNHLDGQFGRLGTNTTRGDSRDLLRARIGFETDSFGLFLFGRNLLDEDGTIFNQRPTGGAPLFSRDHPRQLGVEFTYNFN